MSSLARALAELDPQTGVPRYGEDVVRSVVALLCLDVGGHVDLPRPLVDLLGELVIAAGLTGEEPREVLVPRVRAFVEARVPGELRAVLEREVRERVVASGGDRGAAARALLGDAPATGPLGGGVRPAGTIPASPLLRFLTQTKRS